MRPAGRGELDSLYFNYPEFQAPPLSPPGEHHPVVIVGAGPVGLTAALSLALHGVRSVVLERKHTFNDGSRAICIARQSFQILDQIGAVAPFLDKALGWRIGRSFYRGRQIYEFEMPHRDTDKYLPMYNLQQQYIEQFLWQAADASELIELRWQSMASAIDADDSGVSLAVTTPAGDYTLRADYLLAADGARSPLRSMLGLRLAGENYEGRYVIADVHMRHDYPTVRRALFEPASNPGATVLVHRQPDDIWRIDYQLAEGEDADAAVAEAAVRSKVGAILAEIEHRGDWELEWWSIYTANTLCLDDYRAGRVFFIGDSAHIVPIFGVRGLNNGLADAHNIGWKLAAVLNGGAAPALLDTYSPERRGATLEVFANAGKSARFMTPPTRGHRLLRDAVLSLALEHDFVRPFVNPRQMQPYTYADSALTAGGSSDQGFTGGPRGGAAAPDVRLADGGCLLEHCGIGYTLLVFLGDTLDGPTLAALLGANAPDLRVVTIAPRAAAAAAADIDDSDRRIAAVYDATPGTCYLLRPDLHVAGRWRRAAADEINAALQRGRGG